MEDNYAPKMTDLEFQKLQLKQQQEFVSPPFEDCNICVLARENDSDGDCEDNLTNDDESHNRSLSFGSTKSGNEEEFNLNCSFTGGYMPNTDLSRVDKG